MCKWREREGGREDDENGRRLVYRFVDHYAANNVDVHFIYFRSSVKKSQCYSKCIRLVCSLCSSLSSSNRLFFTFLFFSYHFL